MNITKLFRTHPSLDFKASVFFLVIYDKCKKQGQYYTTTKIEDITALTGMSNKTCRRAIVLLEAEHLLKVEHTARANIYHLINPDFKVKPKNAKEQPP